MRLSPRPTGRLLFAAVSAVVLVGGIAWAQGRGHAAPAGAERIADLGGPERLSDVWPATVTGEGRVPKLDDVNLGSVTYLRTDIDGDLVLLAEGQLGAHSSYLVRSTVSGELRLAGPTTVDTDAAGEAFGVSADRHYARATEAGDEVSVVLGSTPWRAARNVVDFDVPTPAGGGDAVPDGDVQVGAVEVVDEDTVLVGGRAGPYIDERSADGTGTRLLGPEGDPDALVTADREVGLIVSLVRSADGRVVFVAESDDGYRLYALDGDRVEPLADGGSEGNPVAAPDAASYPVNHPSEALPASLTRLDVRTMAPLTPGPDGRVVTVGARQDGVPEISLVDVDTGEVEVMARLDGVEATIREPVLATVTGDDLVFTAEGSLWRLPDAVPAED